MARMWFPSYFHLKDVSELSSMAFSLAEILYQYLYTLIFYKHASINHFSSGSESN